MDLWFSLRDPWSARIECERKFRPDNFQLLPYSSSYRESHIRLTSKSEVRTLVRRNSCRLESTLLPVRGEPFLCDADFLSCSCIHPTLNPQVNVAQGRGMWENGEVRNTEINFHKMATDDGVALSLKVIFDTCLDDEKGQGNTGFWDLDSARQNELIYEYFETQFPKMIGSLTYHDINKDRSHFTSTVFSSLNPGLHTIGVKLVSLKVDLFEPIVQ